MTTPVLHLQPARRIRPHRSDVSRNPFRANRRSDVSRDPNQVRTKAKMVAIHVAPTIERNGTGIGTCRSDVSRDPFLSTHVGAT